MMICVKVFKTKRSNKAVIVDNYWYRLSTTTKNGCMEKWVCCTDGCSNSISWLNGVLVKVNGKAVDSDSKIPKHHKEACWHSMVECKTKLIADELKEKAGKLGASAIPKMFEDKILELKKSGMQEGEIADVMPQYQTYKSTMYRRKHLNYPLIPSLMSELNYFSDVCRVYCETVATEVDNIKTPGKRFLLWDGYEEIWRSRQLKCKDRITIFCSDYGLKLLSQATKIITFVTTSCFLCITSIPDLKSLLSICF
jgi:hypothetical protein